MLPRILAVIDRDGAATLQDYADLLLFCVGLRANLGRFDIVLRGHAVSCAVVQPGAEVLAQAGRRSAQQYLNSLLRSAVRVWADGADLAELGHQGKPLLEGVALADAAAMAAAWCDYEKVWFL